jgi:hypothetical protein
MTTNQPIELGKASKETKQMGPIERDNPQEPTGDKVL